MNSTERFLYWKMHCKDEDLSSQLLEMEADEEKIENAFYKDIEFGTAGIRGVLGVGSNCLNIYTIIKVSEGISRYMIQNGLQSISICRDCRNFSNQFALTAACVFANNGIHVKLADDIMPTPFLSFMVRNCPTDMGVMITASHNSSIYNGYKVYNKFGYQLTDIAAADIAAYIKNVDPFSIFLEPISYYVDRGMVECIDGKLVDEYLDAVKKASFSLKNKLNIVYSPLNGTGYKLVPKVLRENQHFNVEVVREQSYPDGNFPTCKIPNPEKREALEYGIALATSLKYDIVLVTDPDADRIAVAVYHNDDFVLLSGNEVGILLSDYILSVSQSRGRLLSNPIIIKSIVSTPMVDKIAKYYGGSCIDVLTGFKYIGEKITELEESGQSQRFALAFEESYGYLIGTHVRDKDAVVAALLISEMAAEYKTANMTLVDRLEELYSKFGTYEHKLVSKEFFGPAGSKKMADLIESFRNNIPNTLAQSEVIATIDYLYDNTGLPRANVIKLSMKNGCDLIIRPSGTEPLIKFYITSSKSPSENKENIERICSEIEDYFN